jgi:hypothetical protein
MNRFSNLFMFGLISVFPVGGRKLSEGDSFVAAVGDPYRSQGLEWSIFLRILPQIPCIVLLIINHTEVYLQNFKLQIFTVLCKPPTSVLDYFLLRFFIYILISSLASRWKLLSVSVNIFKLPWLIKKSILILMPVYILLAPAHTPGCNWRR